MSLNRVGWRIWSFWIIFVRRFANNAFFFIGILHVYLLVQKLGYKPEDVTQEAMLAHQLLDHYSVHASLLSHFLAMAWSTHSNLVSNSACTKK